MRVSAWLLLCTSPAPVIASEPPSPPIPPDFPSSWATGTLLWEGYYCDNNKWLNQYVTEWSECVPFVRAEESCVGSYFMHAAQGDGNCGCLTVETDCSDAAYVSEDYRVNVHALIEAAPPYPPGQAPSPPPKPPSPPPDPPSPPPPKVPSSWVTGDLVWSGYECRENGSDQYKWLNVYVSDPLDCVQLVRDDAECVGSYYSHGAGGEGNCGCPTEVIDCLDIAVITYHTVVNIHAIMPLPPAAPPYPPGQAPSPPPKVPPSPPPPKVPSSWVTGDLVWSGYECRENGSDQYKWLNVYVSDPLDCVQLVRDDAECVGSYYSHGAGGDGNCGCPTEVIDCLDVAVITVHTVVNIHAIMPLPPPFSPPQPPQPPSAPPSPLQPPDAPPSPPSPPDAPPPPRTADGSGAVGDDPC